MVHVTDTLWNASLTKLRNARILILGCSDRMAVKIHVDHLIDAVAKNCARLERLEFRWDNETLRFSDKNQVRKSLNMISSTFMWMSEAIALRDSIKPPVSWEHFCSADFIFCTEDMLVEDCDYGATKLKLNLSLKG